MATPSRARRKPGINPPRLRVEVTQADIDSGVRKDSGHCIIAEAVQRAYPSAKWVSVDLGTIRMTDPVAGMRYFYLTPRIAQLHLADFDEGRPRSEFKPFTFQVSAFQMRATGGRQGKKATLENVARRRSGEGRNAAGIGNKNPTKVGGDAPPIGALSSDRRTGRVRAYGIRGLIRNDDSGNGDD